MNSSFDVYCKFVHELKASGDDEAIEFAESLQGINDAATIRMEDPKSLLQAAIETAFRLEKKSLRSSAKQVNKAIDEIAKSMVEVRASDSQEIVGFLPAEIGASSEIDPFWNLTV